MAFYDEGKRQIENLECSTPTKSTILNNFDSWYADHGPCPGALLAFFGAKGDTPVSGRYLMYLRYQVLLQYMYKPTTGLSGIPVCPEAEF